MAGHLDINAGHKLEVLFCTVFTGESSPTSSRPNLNIVLKVKICFLSPSVLDLKTWPRVLGVEIDESWRKKSTLTPVSSGAKPPT